MTEQEIIALAKSIADNPNKLNGITGPRFMRLIKEYEHNLVKQLQTIGLVKRAIRQQTIKNGGPRLEL
jgi:hypothetical protein